MGITLGSIYKRGRVYWWKYQLDGRQHAQSLKTASKARANDKRQELMAEYLADPVRFVRTDTNPFIAEFWEEFSAWSKDHKAAGTLRVEARSWAYAVMVLHPVRVADITPAGIERMKAVLKSEGVKGKPLGDASINQVLRHLKAVFNQARKLGLISCANPVVGVKHYRLPVSRPDFLIADEVQCVLWAAVFHSRYQYWICLLGVYAGLRKNEIVNARWEWFDFDNRLLNVKRGPGFELKDREERAIPLSAKLAAALRPFAQGEGYLFHSGKESLGRNAYRYEPKRSFAKVVKNSGVERLTFHLMRHTFGSLHAIAGTSIYKISKWMGHSSVDVTSKHYAGLQAFDNDIDRV